MAINLTAEQVKEAIKGSGGIVSTVAHKLNCDWHTADNFIKRHPTLLTAMADEKHRITDKAKFNLAEAIQKGDLMLSKWWVTVMDAEFVPKQNVDLTSGGEALCVVIRGPSEGDTL